MGTSITLPLRHGVGVRHAPLNPDAADLTPLALARSLPTMRHALRLVDALESELGKRAFVDPSVERPEVRIHVRAPDCNDLIAPVPIVDLALVARDDSGADLGGGTDSRFAIQRARGGTSVSIGRAPAARTVPDIAPTGSDMFAGELVICCDASPVVLTYEDRGLLFGTEVEGISPIAPVAERLAERALAAEHGAYLMLPSAVPGGSGDVLVRAIARLRKAFFDGEVPADAAWAAVDGLDGVALVWAATRDQCLDDWRDELFRRKPRPPVHRDPAGVWPAPTPKNAPGMIVRLPPFPSEPPPRLAAAGFRWMRLIDDSGEVEHALVRDHDDGFTLMGADLVALQSDPIEIETELARCDEVVSSRIRRALVHCPFEMPTTGAILSTYRARSKGRSGVQCMPDRTTAGAEFLPAWLDGARLRHGFARMHRLG